MDVMEKSQSGWESGLQPDERSCLFQIAIDSLTQGILRSNEPFDWTPYHISAGLRELRACGVTLYAESGGLRGYMGTLEPVAPLFQAVHQHTIAAALQDARFTPLQADDVGTITLTISIISAAEPITDIMSFVPGEHGIIFEKNGRRAAFLPEVAAEQGWTREETLGALCRKAGLPEQAWRADASCAIFYTALLSGSSRKTESLSWKTTNSII